jgi:NAD(P)-dependent dehydrogenase (short-subunit alcohol dehydrogenase family)
MSDTPDTAPSRLPETVNVTQTELTRKILSHYLIRPAGEPADVAAMVTHLASQAGSSITGHTCPLNGGFSVTQ